MPSQTLHALYVQSTRAVQGGTTRAQWIVMPPRPQVYNGGAPRKDLADVGTLVFHRIQETERHRPAWRAKEWGTAEEAATKLEAALNERIARGSTISPYVLVQVSIEELDDALLSRSTPYSILNRIKKAGRSRHGLEIK